MGKQALRVVTLVTVGASVLLGACSGGKTSSGPTTVTDSGYATSCSTDDDCVGVYFGDVCGLCATTGANAAINSSAEGAYQNAVNAAESHCPPSTVEGSCTSATTITTCSMGKCTLATCSGAPASPHSCRPTSVNGSGLNTTCAIDSDCITVYFGDVCGFCPPPDNAAINESAAGAYQSAYNAAQSACPPQNGGGSCAAATVGISLCTMGTCQFQECSGFVAMPSNNLHACPSDGGAADGGGQDSGPG